MKIKTIIVDDEPLARKRVSRLLAKEPDIEIAAECSDGLAAISAINIHLPDLIFLDVQMPEISGFDVLQLLSTATQTPAVVFVTAYDQFTIRAFDAHAVDYLLKPFSERRFRQAVARARERLSRRLENRSDEQLSRLIDHLKLNTRFLDRLIVNHKNRLIMVRVDDIDWIETYGNYLKIRSSKKSYLLRETLNNLEARLDSEKFLRIHRTTLVNIDRIRELQPMFGGQYAVILRDGTELILSRSYRKAVLERFEI